jgi:glycosyltransferase involved in cell wall biosynthesis
VDLDAPLARSAGHSLPGVPTRIAHVLAVALRVLHWIVTQLPLALRRCKYASLIRRSRLFDPEFYLSQMAEPERARRYPIWHFLVRGAAAGLDPNPLFDTKDYVERHPDAAKPGKNPLIHFIRVSRRALVSPGPLFDTAFYLARYPDVSASGMNPLAHYLAIGGLEGRVCFPGANAPPPGVGASPRGRFFGNSEILSDALMGRAASLALPHESRILVVDHRIPEPDKDSGSVRMFAVLEILRELGHEVTFVADTPGTLPRYEQDLKSIGVAVLTGRDAAESHLTTNGQQYRFVVLCRAHVIDRYLALVRAHALHATVVYDTVDLHWVRLSRQAELSGDPIVRARAEELRAIERLGALCSDVVLAITDPEREVLRAEAPGARVEILPNVHAPRPTSRPWAERNGLVFIGGFEHEPNVDAVAWFVSDVLPLVRRQLPGTVLHVIGSKAPRAIARLAAPDVNIAGYVPDPTRYFEGSRVFVAPLRYGAGMKGKIGHAMSLGLPVVTTSIGAEGMELVDGEHVLVADEPEAFAAAVVRLHQDELLWARLARNSLRHLEDRFSVRSVRRRIAALFPPPARAATQAIGSAPSARDAS